jgi:hypothetical protein
MILKNRPGKGRLARLTGARQGNDGKSTQQALYCFFCISVDHGNRLVGFYANCQFVLQIA